ncbi:hypothetical protein AALO_G00231850 [Alosa alosa]|uniref:Uncharacterized protein n=1 Tax=Alosa alosa TaxID=278164 RepID=A0AAV6FZ00_9TELE|nr:hypothetical protein AALO_G00231850 [Alosa alosa]
MLERKGKGRSWRCVWTLTSRQRRSTSWRRGRWWWVGLYRSCWSSALLQTQIRYCVCVSVSSPPDTDKVQCVCVWCVCAWCIYHTYKYDNAKGEVACSSYTNVLKHPFDIFC